LPKGIGIILPRRRRYEYQARLKARIIHASAVAPPFRARIKMQNLGLQPIGKKAKAL